MKCEFEDIDFEVENTFEEDVVHKAVEELKEKLKKY